ncbi:MAG: radical SAM family heme chaperone HemW [Clostridia bacterium]|nr:radical SAM family heme chaperone HemW [Clostridia bacterium]MDH7573630.1 radical SAM family heme chaperone HemW [Clostridia bacterium]
MDLSLYLHVPFCLRKCPYCDFVSYPGRGPEETAAYVAGLARELELWARRLNPAPEITTVYVGGGTPSLLPVSLWRQLGAALRCCFRLSPRVEFSVEANPGTLTPELLETLREIGVNRLSLGVQSFDPRFLRLAGRPYHREDILRSAAEARRAGFDNLNLDLIFGFPGQSPDDWRQDLEAALELAPTHLSCYELQLDPQTPWGRAAAEGELVLPEEEERAAMYEYAEERLEKAGFEQYELSNFALPGHACRHNLAYWLRRPYLGVGAAAASFMEERRWINLPALEEYLERVNSGRLPVAEQEELEPEAAMAETMMLGLRLTRGVEAGAFRRRFGREVTEVFGPRLKYLGRLGLIEEGAGYYRLTPRGRLLGNLVFREFV